jgi:hypothetical protein
MATADSESLVRFQSAHAMFHKCDRVDVTIGPAGATTLVSTVDGDIELPLSTPIPESVIEAVRAGANLFLSYHGRRMLGLVAADDPDSLPKPAEEETVDEAHRRFDAMCRKQGFGPVSDPSTLLGEPFDNFDEFFAAATRGYR